MVKNQLRAILRVMTSKFYNSKQQWKTGNRQAKIFYLQLKKEDKC